MKKKGINRTNYWNGEIQYVGQNAAQNFLRNNGSAMKKNVVMASGDCSCNCHGGCSGGDCSSCSYGNS